MFFYRTSWTKQESKTINDRVDLTNLLKRWNDWKARLGHWSVISKKHKRGFKRYIFIRIQKYKIWWWHLGCIQSISTTRIGGGSKGAFYSTCTAQDKEGSSRSFHVGWTKVIVKFGNIQRRGTIDMMFIAYTTIHRYLCTIAWTCITWEEDILWQDTWAVRFIQGEHWQAGTRITKDIRIASDAYYWYHCWRRTWKWLYGTATRYEAFICAWSILRQIM